MNNVFVNKMLEKFYFLIGTKRNKEFYNKLKNIFIGTLDYF